MIRVFYGDDRIKANQEIKQSLGEDYEVLDGPELLPDVLPSIFLGASLFADTRNILIRDLTTNKPVYEQLTNYLDSPHNIILFETKLDKRSAVYKELKDKIEFKEFALPKSPNLGLAFDIYKTAKTNGKKAVSILESIKTEEDPIMLLGLLTSQAIKDYYSRHGNKEKRILKELAITDLQIKTAKVEPWLLIESFLLRMSLLS